MSVISFNGNILGNNMTVLEKPTKNKLLILLVSTSLPRSSIKLYLNRILQAASKGHTVAQYRVGFIYYKK